MDYQGMKVDELRKEVRQRGWTGANVLDARKKELVQFLTTGKRSDKLEAGPLSYTRDADQLTVTNGRDTISTSLHEWQTVFLKVGFVTESGFPEITATAIPKNTQPFQKRNSQNIGRPAADIPTDTRPLLECFRNAEQQGQPFYSTGKSGVYSRRMELPTGFNLIGRDRLQLFIAELIQAGVVQSDRGQLTVPESDKRFQK